MNNSLLLLNPENWTDYDKLFTICTNILKNLPRGKDAKQLLYELFKSIFNHGVPPAKIVKFLETAEYPIPSTELPSVLADIFWLLGLELQKRKTT